MKIKVDLMDTRDGIYIATMQVEPSLRMITGYYGNKPVVSVRELCKVVEDRRPTLRGKAYKILPCNNNYVLNYDIV